MCILLSKRGRVNKTTHRGVGGLTFSPSVVQYGCRSGMTGRVTFSNPHFNVVQHKEIYYV